MTDSPVRLPNWALPTTTDAPFDHLARDVEAGRASIIALGMTVRGARSSRELYQLADRATRRLVDDHGYRVITIEETPSTAAALDAYIAGRRGDLVDVLARAWVPWAVQEFQQVVTWLRSHAAARPQDRVRLVGVDADPATTPDEADGVFAEALLRLADDGAWVVHWGGIAHTAACSATLHDPGGSIRRWPAGARVRTELGERYRSVALTIGWADAPAPIPGPASDLIEHELSQVPSEAFLVDLSHADLPAELSNESGPVRVRAVGPVYDPERDASYSLECPSLQEAFDVVVHQQRSTAATQLV